MKAIVLALLVTSPLIALAHSNPIDMVSDSTTAALKKFKTEETMAASSFSGIKAWVSGASTKVRVYYRNNEANVLYGCIMHHADDGTEHILCTKE